MNYVNQKLVFSPSDIATFHRSEFASYVDRIEKEIPSLLLNLDIQPKQDPMLELLAAQGGEHEASILSSLKVKYGEHNVEEIMRNDPQASEKTIQAMWSGRTVIFQPLLSRDEFTGYADFLVKIDTPSKLGNYSYQVWDAKLSKAVLTEHILQVCTYSWMLEPILGKVEEQAGFYLGGEQNEIIRLAEYFAYFNSVKKQFVDFQNNFVAQINKIPDPALESSHGRWGDLADKLIEQSDSLSQVAGIRVSQIKKLNELDITTMLQLANYEGTAVKGIGKKTFELLKRQAKLQGTSKGKALPEYELLERETGKGFEALPPADESDVFFDIEGHPLLEGGLEYLWGATLRKNTFNADEPKGDGYPFVDWWAHDAVQEKLLIESFIDWVYNRWQANPGMHVYHYASYEITALTKLTGRYNTRIDILDELLRGQVFIDLYRIVKQGLLIGTSSYSIKKVEALYGRKHEGPVANGAQSVVDYEQWRVQNKVGEKHVETPVGWHNSNTLKEIRDYNIEDCESTLELYEWLSDVRTEADISYLPLVNTQTEDGESTKELSSLQLLQKELKDTYKNKIELQNDPIAKDLMDLLEFHSRENKPMWWGYYERLSAVDEQLYTNDLAIVGAAVIDKKCEDNSITLSMSFDAEQIYRKDKFSSVLVRELDNVKAKKFNFDEENEIITVKLNAEDVDHVPEQLTLIGVEGGINTSAIEASLASITKQYFGERIEGKRGISKLLHQLLQKNTPSFKGEAWPLNRKNTDSDEDWLTKISGAVAAMNDAVMAIQGPPGAGKTYTASHIIRDLVAKGKRIGIMSNSHAAILNLQTEVYCLAPNVANIKIGGAGKNQKEFRECFSTDEYPNFDYRPSASFAKSKPYESYQVVGATVFAFAKSFAQESPLDYLFVDEASQVSLANLVAVTPSAKNIVLMGDQMQLEQPIQGKHPGVAAKSALEHLLAGHAIVPIEQGIFLSKTYRMHPDVCQPISDLVYQSKLTSAADRENQLVIWPEQQDKMKPSGIQFIPVKHDANTQESIEELEKIQLLITDLSRSKLIDKDGKERPFTKEDVLIVAPYNMQVNLLKQHLSDEYRIGTIDKFQGQEAQVVIISMASSLPAESNRGIDFLFDVNRLNVAVSRAKALAIIVASPELTKVKAGNAEQAKKLGAYYRLIDLDSTTNSQKSKMEDKLIINPLITPKIVSVLENCKSKQPVILVKDIIEKINRAKGHLDIWHTNSNGGDVRIGIYGQGKKALKCFVLFQIKEDAIYFNLAHSFFVEILGKGYSFQDLSAFMATHHLPSFEIVNGSNQNSWGAKITVNSKNNQEIEQTIQLLNGLN